MTFSLILATYNRVDTLPHLFASIAKQSGVDLECVIIDQNADDRLRPVVEEWESKFPIRVIRAEPHLSQARNRALDEATGDIIAFPDDDCWYSDGLLSRVQEFFAAHQEYDLLTVGMTDGEGMSSGNRWVQDRCELAPINIFRTTSTQSVFVRRSPKTASVRFDTGIGPNSGTPFGCGEDTDYVLAVMDAGARGYFDRSMVVHHPRKDMLSGNIEADRAMNYGTGMGHVLRKHKLGWLCLLFLIYDPIRAGLCMLLMRRKAATLCIAHCRGVLRGYRLPLTAIAVPQPASR